MRIEDAKTKLKARGFDVRKAPIPGPTLHTISKCRERCESNECGAYGVTWACPPGSATPGECIEMLSGYGSAALITRTYELNPRDRRAAEAAALQFQDDCRKAAVALREEGADIFMMADGKCGYCESCTYPDAECKHPEMLVPSISGFGIVMSDYVKECGREFSFFDDRVEFFGIMLLR
ncbi:MAG: DUF2284 domain-containing protein [Candidatus Methanomethylophilaceae archaeon]